MELFDIARGFWELYCLLIPYQGCENTTVGIAASLVVLLLVCSRLIEPSDYRPLGCS